jgi:hypothetical protein
VTRVYHRRRARLPDNLFVPDCICRAMTTRGFRYLNLLTALACGSAHAEGPRVGVEYEREKERGVVNHGFSVKPGWEFSKTSPINLVELLIDHNEDARADSDGVRERETRVFLRLRHNRELASNLGYFVRGGVGRSVNNEKNFNYGYVEAGLKYERGRWGWTVAWREIVSIDGTDGQRATKITTGPSLNLDARNEVELRYSKTYRDKDGHAWQLGYTHKF